mmetsp:Transcript_2632/g.11262  ORF Transcript_2632/g.11262 Transcript_2632/m.11262 type:complete len:292 (+) Transcript_2632:52-927(+)
MLTLSILSALRRRRRLRPPCPCPARWVPCPARGVSPTGCTGADSSRPLCDWQRRRAGRGKTLVGGRYMPTPPRMVCPCDLLMIMAKAGRTGNCVLVQWYGWRSSLGVSLMRGTHTFLTAPRSSLNSHSSKSLDTTRFSVNIVPLHIPLAGSRLRSSMSGMPEFLRRQPRPRPGVQNSVRMLFRSTSSPDSASEERRCTSSPPGKRAVTCSFISSTTLLVLASIKLSPTMGDPWARPGNTKSMRPSRPPSRHSRLGKRHQHFPQSSGGPNSSASHATQCMEKLNHDSSKCHS